MNYESKIVENFKLENFDGSQFDFFEFGKNSHVLIIFFRGVWCNHCKKQMQEIQNKLNEFKQLKIKILAIASDSKLNLSLLKTFLKLDFTILADPNLKVINKFNLQTKYKDKQVSKPAIFLITPENKIAYSYISQDYDDRLSAVEILNKLRKILIKNYET